MPETKLIPTVTTLNVTGSTIKIFTEYVGQDLPYILSVFIADQVGSLNNISYIEGQLIANFKSEKYSNDIDLFIDNEGNLVVKSLGGDVENYSIDTEGNFIWTE